jgi:hypothetical protein
MPLGTFLNGRPPSRGLVWLALTDTATIIAGTVASDSGGGVTSTWAPTGTVDCRIDPLSGANSRITGGAIDERSTHVVTVPTGSTVSVTNRVAIANRGTYEVTAVRDRTDQLTQVFEVIAL